MKRKLNLSFLASKVDHTLLKADATKKQIEKLCAQANKHGMRSVCVNPNYVKLCAKLLKDSNVRVCTVVGFPLGALTVKTKVYEVKNAINDGADDIDVVVNIGAVKSKSYNEVDRELNALRKVCKGKFLKVIFETALLNKDEIVRLCKLSLKNRIDCVKTSTGFSSRGASLEDIKIMRRVVGKKAQIKASGGIKTLAMFLALIESGADIIGTSSFMAMLKEKIA